MSDKMSYFPQSFLLSQVASRPPSKKEKSIFANALDVSDLGMQKMVKIAKLTGNYIPENVISKITTGKSATQLDEKFISLENHKLSSLVPELRLYRRSDDGSVTPFYFPVVSDYEFEGERVNLNKSFSSNSAVIQNFSVTYTGKNPYQASKNFLQASLSINVDNISTLFHVPLDNKNDYAPLAHLFLIRVDKGARKAPGQKKSRSPSVFDGGEACNIVASLGYANHQTEVLGPQEMRIIEENRMLINLYYASHDLSMQPDGSATLNVSYTGFLSANRGNSSLDLIMPSRTKTKIARDKSSSKINKKEKKDIKNTDEKGKENKEKAKLTKEQEVAKANLRDTSRAFGKIINNLFVNSKIHTVKGNSFSVSRMEVTKPEKKPDNSKKQDDSKKQKSQAPRKEFDFFGTKPPDDGSDPHAILDKNYIHYVTFGDFLDAYLKVIVTSFDDVKKEINDLLNKTKKENPKSAKQLESVRDEVLSDYTKLQQRMRKINILMTDFKFCLKKENQDSQVIRSMNIADVPIALDTIYTLVYDELISTRKSFFDFSSFIEDFSLTLLSRSFGSLPGADFIRDVTFMITDFSGKPLSAENIKKGNLKLVDLPKPTGDVSKEAIKDLSQYYVFHQKAPMWTRSVGSGSKKKDLGKGIIHLNASQDRGIVKSISFSRISQPAREAYMIVRNGQLYDELRYPHNATVEMIGNNIFFPSCCVYINPDTLGFGDPREEDSIARRLGFGGYYMSGQVTTTYSAGSLTTSMQLYFNSFPEIGDEQPLLSSNVRRSIKENRL